MGTNPEVPRTAIEKLKPDLLYVIAGDLEALDLLMKHIDSGEKWTPAAGNLTPDDIEHVLIDAFSDDVLSTMLENIQNGMGWAESKVGRGRANFYVNLSGGANLMVIGSALAGVAIPRLNLVYALDPRKNPGMPSEDLVQQMPMLSDLQKATDKINNSTPARLRILRAVQNAPIGAVVADIARSLGQSNQRVAKVLGELKMYKAVDTTGPSKRNVLWTITEIGRLVLKINI